jgi:3-dehydroquinate dehydratase / shikimate dehydrogenase
MDSKHEHICVSLCERNIDALAKAIKRSAEAGLVEIRLDCLDHETLKSGFEHIRKLLLNSPVPAIVTFRPAEQGSGSNAGLETRSAFWTEQGFGLASQLCDLEIELAEHLARTTRAASTQIDWNRVICSYHHFSGVPSDLKQTYERLAATPARILKVAVAVRDVTDCVDLFQLLDRARAEGREMIAIGMGAAGLATRILGPSRGAFLTYAAPDEKSATAPGQVTVGDLKTLYRIDQIDQQTQIMGLVGLPVAHSLSPHAHNAAFGFASIKAVYIPFEVSDLASFVKRMIHPRTREVDWNMRGLSITAPHKTTVMDYLDWVDPVGTEIGAVNTIIVEDEKLCGYNTDADALIQTLAGKLGSLNQARVAVIGAGGVASAALYGLRQQGSSTTVFARDLNKAKRLAEAFGANSKSLIEASFEGFDAVINATPLGTVGEFEAVTPATANQLRGARLAYDLVYNPIETRFLREARTAGCRTIGGLSMFVSQAEKQFSLWTGAKAPEDVMYLAAEKALKRK